VSGEIAIRMKTNNCVQRRVEGYRDREASEMHPLAFCRQLTNCTDLLTHELPESHSVRASLLHGLGTFVTGEGDQHQFSDQDKSQDCTRSKLNNLKYAFLDSAINGLVMHEWLIRYFEHGE
jgi:hypothetical protein